MTFITKQAGLLRSARSWGVLGLLLALAFLTVGEPITKLEPAFGQVGQPRTPQTLDDLFEAVARIVPDFGGMFLTDNEQVLQVYLLDPSPEKVRAVTNAISQVFGQIIPKGGIKALKGQYGFLQLREWYTRMVGPILSTPGVTFTDIDEAKNRLGIGIETRDVEARVVEQLGKLGIPREVVVIEVTRVIVTAPPEAEGREARQKGSYEPTSLALQSPTLQNKVRPTEGGYQIIPDNGFGGACTLGFNAVRAGVRGFVTSTWCTAAVWQPDGMRFFQAGPFDVVGAETVDPPGFLGSGFPCPKYTRCRYSAAAFVEYDPAVSSAEGVIGRTTGVTTTANYIITVAGQFWIVSPPTKPYLVGLQLNKVGRRTGWTTGTIAGTCKDWSFPGKLLLCQYQVQNLTIQHIADPFGTDAGAPVFRIPISSNAVQLYGMLWGVVNSPPNLAYKQFTFSPIGGVPFQQTGIQWPTDLGPLGYVGCFPPNPPC